MCELSENVWRVLACPHCQEQLQATSQGAECTVCRRQFPKRRRGLDVRLLEEKTARLELTLFRPVPEVAPEIFAPMGACPQPQVDFTGFAAPRHLDDALLSYFPKASNGKDLALDLGCGDESARSACELAGFEYIGLDYYSADATLLGDVHALPFQNESVGFVIRYPAIMLQEAERVLKAGGKLIGSVSFLEPFHDKSFYHHTHLGVFSALDSAGFEVERIAPGADWDGLKAQAQMILFPRMPRALAGWLVWPLRMFHRLWWRAFTSSKPEADNYGRRLRATAGGFIFVARKRFL
jgi:SAM-dependent methyltransferase